jgi:hypothetical protein
MIPELAGKHRRQSCEMRRAELLSCGAVCGVLSRPPVLETRSLFLSINTYCRVVCGWPCEGGELYDEGGSNLLHGSGDQRGWDLSVFLNLIFVHVSAFVLCCSARTHLSVALESLG